MSNLELKNKLIDSRMFEKESDYQIIEEVYKIFNSELVDNEFIKIMFYGLDDNTEDLEVTTNLIDIIFSISDKDNISKRLASIILSNISVCIPHASYFLKKIIGIAVSQKNIENLKNEAHSCKEKEILINILDELSNEKDFSSNWIFRKNLSELVSLLKS